MGRLMLEGVKKSFGGVDVIRYEDHAVYQDLSQ